jgi:hypothetical protein
MASGLAASCTTSCGAETRAGLPPVTTGKPPLMEFASGRTSIPTVAGAIGRAAALCDPDATDESVTQLVERFEDDERPATALDLAQTLTTAVAEIDPEGESGALALTASAAGWLATNIDRSDEREIVLREAARAAFEGSLPDEVSEWLTDQGLEEL